MSLEKFRITHSTLIEHYQFIEAHIDGIYAAVSDKPFRIGVQEVERDSLGGVIRELRELEKEKHIRVLTDDTYDQLRKIVERRNFWCHSCYFELSFDRETGGPARVRDIQTMLEDLQNAELWREKLRLMKLELLTKKREK
jgi:hypothetical protein